MTQAEGRLLAMGAMARGLVGLGLEGPQQFVVITASAQSSLHTNYRSTTLRTSIQDLFPKVLCLKGTTENVQPLRNN